MGARPPCRSRPIARNREPRPGWPLPDSFRFQGEAIRRSNCALALTAAYANEAARRQAGHHQRSAGQRLPSRKRPRGSLALRAAKFESLRTRHFLKIRTWSKRALAVSSIRPAALRRALPSTGDCGENDFLGEAAAGAVFQRYRSAIPFDDFLGDGEAEAGTRDRLPAAEIDAEKWLERLVQ